MAQLVRFAPPTQMDALRALLAGWSEVDRSFETAFFRSLQALRQLACPELGRWLLRVATPAGLRRVIVSASARFDWLEWELHLFNLLRNETDLALFDEACARLGGLCTRHALERLEQLKGLRRDEERQEILERELGLYHSGLSFEDCLTQVLQGEGSADRARLGARGLAALAEPEHLGELLGALPQGDGLARHLLLRIIAFVPDPSVGDILLFLLQDARDQLRDSRRLGVLLEELRPLRLNGQRETVLGLLRERLQARSPELGEALEAALVDETHRPSEALGPLGDGASGPLEAFLVEDLGLLLEGKTATHTRLLTERGGEIPALLSRLDQTLDELAVLLLERVEAGQLPLEALLPTFEALLLAEGGGEDLHLAYLRLIPHDDQPRLDRLLAEPDRGKRLRCIEVLGAREEDGLVPFFLRAMNDPDPDIEKVAIRQFGKLPSGLPAMMNLFRSGQPERVRQAIHFFTENRAKAAAKPLMAFLSSEGPDDLMVDAATALGSIGNPATAPALLTQLHNGKPLALQVALVEALSRLRTPAASLGLLKKAETILFPQVIILILEGALAAFPSFDQPFPVEQLKPLETLVERCCDQREGAGQWVRTVLLLQDLYVFDAGIYERLRDRFTESLADLRQKRAWDRENSEQIAEALKKLTRRAENLQNIETREPALGAELAAFPATGPKRLEAILKLKEDLTGSEPIFSAPFARQVVAFLRAQLTKGQQDHYQQLLLIEVAGLARQAGMVDPLRELHAHETKLDVRRAIRGALRALGLTDREIDRRPPIRSILLFEPNAFYRKRLVAALEGNGRNIAVAATRDEAASVLAAKPRDLLITEIRDSQGDLAPWVESLWDQHRFLHALVSTTEHDPGVLAERPWIIGRLYKPYPLGELMSFFEE
jgi:CheY-like chemotaxis protein